jgi:CRP/FNR family transcriptional regulator, cyclic AMP receptor protein
MFNKLFRKKSPSVSAAPVRIVQGSATAELAARLLIEPSALLRLTREDARVVVGYMEPHQIAEGTTFIQEGDAYDTGFLMLVLGGEVTVETIVVSRTEPITLTVLGQGSLIGEMGLLDGEPRSASCTASADVLCAILTREALEQLLSEAPAVAAKFMMAVSLRIAKRLRDSADKLKMYAQLTQAMEEEISHRTHADNLLTQLRSQAVAGQSGA